VHRNYEQFNYSSDTKVVVGEVSTLVCLPFCHLATLDGLFPGALGYFSLDGATDLSVVIRTIVVEGNRESNQLSQAKRMELTGRYEYRFRRRNHLVVRSG
jgi:hypothetical protein